LTIITTLERTCPCGPVVKHSAAMCSRTWCVQWPGFAPQPRCIHLPKNTYDEQRDDPGQEKEESTVTVADALISSVKVLAALK